MGSMGKSHRQQNAIAQILEWCRIQNDIFHCWRVCIRNVQYTKTNGAGLFEIFESLQHLTLRFILWMCL